MRYLWGRIEIELQAKEFLISPKRKKKNKQTKKDNKYIENSVSK